MSNPSNQIASSQDSVWRAGSHITQLDGVRGLAILIVTLYRFSKELPTDTYVGNLLHKALMLGDRGVDLFLVLSGFLITGILVDAKGRKNYFRNFLARRSLRIFPLYFAALVLFVYAFNWLNPAAPMFRQAQENQFYLWTYLTNVKMSLEGAWCFGGLDHFWSLAVEEHFYLVWPLVVFLCSPRTALRLACVLAALSAGSRILFAMVSDNGVAPDVLTVFRCDALLIGSALALQIRSPGGLRPLKFISFFVFALCFICGMACALSDRRMFTISHTLWPLIWSSIMIWLLLAERQSLLAKAFNIVPLRTLGKYSYAMYVFQSPLIPITAGVVSAAQFTAWVGDSVLGHLLYIAAMFALTYAAALLSWHVLEKHCLKLKDWFPTHDTTSLDKSKQAVPVNLQSHLSQP